jgi:tetratricopeptide (TPR) repeat protein
MPKPVAVSSCRHRFAANNTPPKEIAMAASHYANRLILSLAAALMSVVPIATLGSSAALAVDTISSKDAPDLTSVRAKIKSKDYHGALVELKSLADTNQHADVYSLLGFSLRKTGDYTTALTYYKKALDYDADHKGAHEYLGELYIETGQLTQAREQLAVLEKLCPGGCEEREDLENALAAVPAKTN